MTKAFVKPFEVLAEHISDAGTLTSNALTAIGDSKSISFSNLPKLVNLDLTGIKKDVSVFAFGCSALETVEGKAMNKFMAFDCPELQKINTQAHTVGVARSNNLQSIEGSSQNVMVKECQNVGFSGLPDLKNLTVIGHQGKELPPLSEEAKDVDLNLVNSPNVKKLPEQVKGVDLEQSGISEYKQKELSVGKEDITKRSTKNSQQESEMGQSIVEFLQNAIASALEGQGKGKGKEEEKEKGNTVIDLTIVMLKAMINAITALFNGIAKLLGGGSSKAQSNNNREHEGTEYGQELEREQAFWNKMFAKSEQKVQEPSQTRESNTGQKEVEEKEITPKQILDTIHARKDLADAKDRLVKNPEMKNVLNAISKDKKEEAKEVDQANVETTLEQKQDKEVAAKSNDKKAFDEVINEMKSVFKNANVQSTAGGHVQADAPKGQAPSQGGHQQGA